MVSNILGKFRFSLFLFIFLIQFFAFTQVFAQQFYPVQVRSYVQTPSVYLEDYYNPDNFRVQVTLTDRFVPNLDVVLNLTVKGPNSVLFSTKTGIDLTLNGGFTYTLSRFELGKLLAASNLSQVPTSIPENTYTFLFSVTDRLSGATVSNSLTDFSTVLVTLFDPPMLSYPANGQILDFGISSQNFMLSWIPRSFSLNPQEQVKYQLIMVQVPENRNAYDAIQMAEFKVNSIIDNIAFNSFTYDPSLIELTPGFTYAWRIQAYEERDGKKVSSRFRNQGKSDVFTLKVKEQCPPIFLQQYELVSNSISNKQEVLLSWNKEPQHELYEIKYRPFGNSQWTIVQQTGNFFSLSDQVLIKNKDYEYSVSARCKGWQDAAYGGLFKLPGGDCEAPAPILVESNTAEGISLKWDAVPAANTYNLYYTDANGKKNEIKDLSNPTAKLPAIDAGAYTIRVDAVCSNATATGIEMELAYNEKSLAGNCPIPSPFNFLAQRNLVSIDPLEAKLSWPKLPVHESYKITWYQSGSADLSSSEVVSTPEALVKSINSNEFYQYTIEYTCKGGKKSTTPVGGFRIENAGGGLNLSPTTADCFPPAVTSAEAKNSTSARIDWAKVSVAQEYLVVYYPKGLPDQEKIFTTSAADARLTNLVEGATYTYKIRCRCSGNYSIDSELGEFDLTKFYTNDKCDSVANLIVNKVAETEIQLSWPYPQEVKNKYDEHSAYTIRYKENGQVWADAYTIDFQLTTDLKTLFDDTKTVKKTIDQLSSGTRYDIEVKARCGTQIAKANNPLSATTKEEQAADCSSGGVCDRTSKKPISTISVGDTIGMADCSIVIATIEADTKGTNLWKGTGTTKIPLLGQSEPIQAKVNFDSLLVNETACVLDGNVDLDLEVTILTDEQKATIKGIVNKAKELTNDAKNISDKIADGAETASEYGNQGLDYFQGGGNVGRVKTGGLNEGTTTAAELNNIKVNGDQISIGGMDYPVADFPKLFKDENGNVYAVAANGTKTEVGKYDTSLTGYQDSIPATSPVLTFSANSSASYAFDAWQKEYEKSVVMQPHYLSLANKFYSAKAIIPATTDKVDFSLSDGNKNNLTFVNRDGFVFKTLDKNTLQLVGGPVGDAQEVFALYDENGKKKLIGALLLASYTPKQKKVYIVPVKMGNGFNVNLSQVQEQLNKAYGGIGVNYTVEFDKTFDTNSDWCEGSNCDFSTGGSGLLNNDYTGVEAKVRDAYIDFKGEDNLDPDAAYMFAIGVTKADKGDEALEGKMNFGKQFGFLYAAGSQNSKTIGRTLAHELGHGNYKLHHIFADMYLGKDITYTSNNLMSYKNDADALALNKLQWDVVHDPGVTWGIFKRDRDQVLSAGYWMDPVGNPFYLGESKGVINVGKLVSGEHVNGLVYEWKTKEGVAWKAQIENNKFYGFYQIVNGAFTGEPFVYSLIAQGQMISINYLKYNFNCTSDYIYKNINAIRKSPTPTEVKAGLTILDYIDLSKPYTVSAANQAIGGCMYNDEDILSYVVSETNARMRQKTNPYNTLSTSLEKGREVKLLNQLTNTRSLVKYVGETTDYCVAADKLTPIIIEKDKRQYNINPTCSLFVMAYSANQVSPFDKTKTFSRTKSCGEYSLIRDIDGNEAWILNTDLRVILSFSINSNTIPVQPNGFLYITNNAEMPPLTISHNKADVVANIAFKLRIRYERNGRNDVVNYPNNNTWHTLTSGQSWSLNYGNITDNGITRPIIRGGLVELTYKIGNAVEEILQFNIRGTNPTEQLLHEFMTQQNYNQWYFIKIFRHESGTHDENEIKQFNVDGRLGKHWDQSKRCPNLGPPHGYGIGQLDNIGLVWGDPVPGLSGGRAPSQSLWDWKFNVTTAVGFFRDDKVLTTQNLWNGYQAAVQAWNATHPENLISNNVTINTSSIPTEEGISVSSITYSDANRSYVFAVNPNANQLSFSLANAIRYYNGGNYCVLVRPSGQKPYWRVNKLNSLNSPFDYVERICTGTGWMNAY